MVRSHAHSCVLLAPTLPPPRWRAPPRCDTSRGWRTSRRRGCHTAGTAGIWWSSDAAAPATRERNTIMDARFDIMSNALAGKFAKRFANAAMVIAQSPLPKSTQKLVSLRASQINGCSFCTDMHTKDATAAGETAVRPNLVAAWREATVFTEAERAALALTEEATRIA